VSLHPGSRLGAYEIQTLLGSGGIGEVYRARDTRLDRTVAIKVLQGHLTIQPEVRQRFERYRPTGNDFSSASQNGPGSFRPQPST
jgi:eukaryotic-like serine/threonine-protein kinase